MKAKTKFALALVLTLTFVLTLVGTAGASSSGQATVTSISGDSSFTITPVAVLQLPGQTTTAGGLIVPSGFPLGEKQFEGNGVLVSGLSYGTAKACFPISAVNQGWGGKVGYWDGSFWKLLDTSISTPQESATSWACANISNNGTYALLTWVVDASKLVVTKTKLPECSFASSINWEDDYGYFPGDGGAVLSVILPESVPLGTPVDYIITKVDPDWEGEILSGMSGSTTVAINEYLGRSAIFSDNLFTASVYPGPYFIARFTFPKLGCYMDLDFEALELY
ncbi:MAG: hypothetical protein VB013_11960 [Anaerolineaceae bacterium]|nr:hypothetical protein [Anaerolineaceae bacterium]